jgi:hypothetical protein
MNVERAQVGQATAVRAVKRRAVKVQCIDQTFGDDRISPVNDNNLSTTSVHAGTAISAASSYGYRIVPHCTSHSSSATGLIPSCRCWTARQLVEHVVLGCRIQSNS